MVQNKRDELYKLSNEMINLFIKDIFSKNKTDIEKAKSNITDEQRESLKESLNHLQEQVEGFIHDQKASKTITEDNQKNKDEPSLSPLKETLKKKAETEIESDDRVDDDMEEE